MRILWKIVFILGALLPAMVHSNSRVYNVKTFDTPHGLGLSFDWEWPSEEYYNPNNLCPGRPGWRCWVAVSYNYGDLSWGGWPMSEFPYEVIPLDRIRKIFNQKWGTKGHVEVPRFIPKQYIDRFPWGRACIEFQIYQSRTGVSGHRLPSATCAIINKPTASCEALPPIAFDFGPVQAGTTSGQRMEIVHNLSCSDATLTKFRLINPLHLSRNIEAEITLNGKVLNTNGIDIPAVSGITPLTITATLKGDEKIAGKYSASSVIVMDFH